ncbi:MAG: carboxypeptidase-like regulatory domain-containing protein [Flavobacteriales bacterium]
MGRSFFRAALVAVLLVLSAGGAQAQRFLVKLSGVVTDHFSGAPMKGVRVRLLKAGKAETEATTRSDGRYEFRLDRGWRYAVWFSHEGSVTKHINIDTEEVPPYPDVPFFEMDVQMTLFPWVPDLDLSPFDQALGEAAYKPSVRNMSWDVEYTERLRPILSKVMDEYEKTYKGYYKRKDQGRRPPRERLGPPVDSTDTNGR